MTMKLKINRNMDHVLLDHYLVGSAKVPKFKGF